MNAGLGVAGSVFAVVAALLHVVIFALESVLWSRPSTYRRFGVRTSEDAEVLRPMAYNQGFYNVFLALGTALGLVLVATGAARDAGLGIVLFALASMVLAAVVLVTSNPRLWRAALLQGAAPALGVVLLVLALAVG
jgi:putative membrane protein